MLVVAVALQRNKQTKSPPPKLLGTVGCGEGGPAGPGGGGQGLGRGRAEWGRAPPALRLCTRTPAPQRTARAGWRSEMGMFPGSGRREGAAGGVVQAPGPGQRGADTDRQHGQACSSGRSPPPRAARGRRWTRRGLRGPQAAAAAGTSGQAPAAWGGVQMEPSQRGRTGASLHCQSLPVGHPPRRQQAESLGAGGRGSRKAGPSIPALA